MEFNNSTNSTAERNTKDCSALHRAWLITWNNYSEDDLNWYKKYCEDRCTKFRYQTEIGKEGTPHIQGALLFKSARSFSAVNKDLPKCHIEWSPNWNRIKNYCKKNETSTGICGESECKPRFKFSIEDDLEDKELYNWQKDIMEIISKKPDSRSIYWFWEPNGNIGKTSLARHICIQDSKVLYLTGGPSNMKYGVFQAVESGIDVRTIILDYTRSQEDTISFQGIEEIKNAIFYNTKYECKMCIYNHPHIIIFANFEPDEERLSKDRWVIRKLQTPSKEDTH